MSASARRGEQQRAGEGAAAGAGDADLGVARDLAVAGLAPELHARLVDEAEAVQPAGRELAAVGVERELAVERDALRRPRRTGPTRPCRRTPSPRATPS